MDDTLYRLLSISLTLYGVELGQTNKELNTTHNIRLEALEQRLDKLITILEKENDIKNG